MATSDPHKPPVSRSTPDFRVNSRADPESLMVFRWRANDGPTLNAGLVAL